VATDPAPYPASALTAQRSREESTMKMNIGDTERIVRVAIGLVILPLAFVGPRSPWGWLGVLPLASGALGWCPPYALFRFSTRR
jgi:hypothetical protein